MKRQIKTKFLLAVCLLSWLVYVSFAEASLSYSKSQYPNIWDELSAKFEFEVSEKKNKTSPALAQ